MPIASAGTIIIFHMDAFWHAFIPLFVALDGVGLLPMFWTLTHRFSPPERRRAVAHAVITAFLVALSFLFVSRFVFALMGLELADLMVAGGIVLCVLSIRELLLPEPPPEGRFDSPGIVPLGVPLLTGPAVLATVVLVRDRHGWSLTLAALVANMALVWLILWCAEWLMRRLGQEGARVISKVAHLVLTAFGVMLVRQGIMAFRSAGGG